MPVPLVTVSDIIMDQQGRPVQGAEVTARLDRVETYDGLVVPAQARAVSGEDGRFELSLFPNALGSQGSRYEVRVSTPSGALVRGLATVPATGGLLREIMDLPAPGTFVESLVFQAVASAQAAEAARDEAESAGASAATSAAAAEAAESGASSARQRAEDASATAVAARDLAASARDGAVAARDAAQTARAEAESARDVVLAERPPHARLIGGLAYQALLGLTAPSLELDAWKARDNANGVPAGFTFTRASSATRIGPTGLVESVANGALRHEWDSKTLDYLGILIEESRTNLVLQSNGIAGAGGVFEPQEATATLNAGVSPSGSADATRLIESATTATHRLRWWSVGSQLAASSAYTFSCHAKAGERASLTLILGGSASFHLTTGAITADQGVVAGMRTLPNGWWRCWITVTTPSIPSSGSPYADIRIGNGSTTSYLGDGASSIYVWGAQLEAGAFPTSYISTATSASTRAADVLTRSTAGWYRPDEGSWMGEWFTRAPGATAWALLASLGSAYTDVLLLGIVGTGTGMFRVRAGGADQCNFWGAVPDGLHRHALAYRANDFAYAADGGAAQTDSTGAVPALLGQTLYVGRSSTGDGSYANGHIRRLVYFPKRLTNAQLQELTYAA